MSKPIKRAADGFTILEMLIVLAVAGLIFMIIFNAIPALMRNSRNDERKQDVAAVLSAISHYELANSGTTFPAPCSTLPNPASCADTLLQYTKTTYYDKSASPSFLTVHIDKALQDPTVKTVAGPEAVDVYNFHLCKPDIAGLKGVGATSAGAGYNDIVALYDVEVSSGLSIQCQQL